MQLTYIIYQIYWNYGKRCEMPPAIWEKRRKCWHLASSQLHKSLELQSFFFLLLGRATLLSNFHSLNSLCTWWCFCISRTIFWCAQKLTLWPSCYQKKWKGFLLRMDCLHRFHFLKLWWARKIVWKNRPIWCKDRWSPARAKRGSSTGKVSTHMAISSAHLLCGSISLHLLAYLNYWRSLGSVLLAPSFLHREWRLLTSAQGGKSWWDDSWTHFHIVLARCYSLQS